MSRIAIGAGIVLAAIGATRSAAQSKEGAAWKVIVRIVPNPLPVGRCAAVRVELQDDEGYQSSQLPDGRAADFRRFKYESSARESFKWQNDDPSQGYLCADKDAKPARTVVTVTVADGVTGSVELTSLAAGQTAMAVQYPPQGPLRRAGTVSRRVTGAAQLAVPLALQANVVTTSALSMTGQYFVISPRDIVTHALAMTGQYFVIPPRDVVTAALAMTGQYFVLAPSTVTTAPLAFTGTATTPATIADPASGRAAPRKLPTRPPQSREQQR